MRRVQALLILVVCSALSSAQAQRAPQNARQALIDMFFGKPGSLEKHLPEATKAALREASAGGPSLLQQFSMLSAQMNTPQTHFQFFELRQRFRRRRRLLGAHEVAAIDHAPLRTSEDLG